MNSHTLMALVGSISAIQLQRHHHHHHNYGQEFLQLQREPLLANDASPLEVHQMPESADHPMDYFVPDFGMDYESQYT